MHMEPFRLDEFTSHLAGGQPGGEVRGDGVVSAGDVVAIDRDVVTVPQIQDAL